MNKENLEKSGWIFKYEYGNILHFEKGDWKEEPSALLILNKDRIKIYTTDEGFNDGDPNCSIKFNGKCEDVEAFNKICELIEIKI